MAKRNKAKTQVDLAGEPPVSNNPFAGLAGMRESLPAGETGVDGPTGPPAPTKEFAPKLVLARQRKGHGGKTVTVLSGVLVTGDDRRSFVRELGKALGTSVREDGEDIVIGGDQRDRAKDWLEARGAKRVITSG